MTALAAGCTGSSKNGNGTDGSRAFRASDTLYTRQMAMSIYGYQPVRALHALGHHEEGMAKLDSVISQLDAAFLREDNRGTFNELGALIIALKRKILLLTSHDQYAEILPLANLMLIRLDNYEKNPDAFHDGSHREPNTAEKRAYYIQFYRNQELNHITKAFAALGERDNLRTAFEKVDSGVRKITAHEQIADAVRYKDKFHKLNEIPGSPNLSSMTNEQLYQYINEIVIRERLFCDPKFGREDIMERFKLSEDRVGTVFSKGSEHAKMSSYIL